MTASPGPPKEAPAEQRKPSRDGSSAAAPSRHGSAAPFPLIAPELAADYERSLAQKRRPRWPAKVGAALMVFVIGAGAGLFGAWWSGIGFDFEAIQGRTMTESEAARAAVRPDADGAAVAGASAAKPGLPTPKSARTGMSPSELPYDGGKPQASAPEAPAVSAPPATENSSGASAAPATVRSSGDPVDDDVPAAPTAGALAEKEPAPAAPATAREPQRPAAQVKGPATRPEPKPMEKRVVSPPKSRALTESERLAKQREIERIRRQAAEELKRKTELQRQNEQARLRQNPSAAQAPGRTSSLQMANAQSAEPARLSSRVAQCESEPNLFQREICKWQLCSGQWGKNGCPSYGQAPSAY